MPAPFHITGVGIYYKQLGISVESISQDFPPSDVTTHHLFVPPFSPHTPAKCPEGGTDPE